MDECELAYGSLSGTSVYEGPSLFMGELASVGSVAAFRGFGSTGERLERYERERRCDGLECFVAAGGTDLSSSADPAVPDRGRLLGLLMPFWLD